jgi:hypothetical protein
MGDWLATIKCFYRNNFEFTDRGGYAERFQLKRNEIYQHGHISFIRKDQKIYTVGIDGDTSLVYYDHRIDEFPTSIVIYDRAEYNSSTSGIFHKYKKVNP